MLTWVCVFLLQTLALGFADPALRVPLSPHSSAVHEEVRCGNRAPDFRYRPLPLVLGLSCDVTSVT
jgi:hypothetical protein